MDVRGELALKIAPLASAAPSHWRDFVEAFKKYEDAARDRCIAAASENLSVAQGEARAIGHLSRLFDKAVKTPSRP